MHSRLARIAVLFLLASSATTAWAQGRPYRHYGVEDGLAGSTVYCVHQDEEGYLWFGTSAGLSRFDGTSFRTFTDRDGLPNNEVLELTADPFGRLWIQCFEAPPCFLQDGVVHNPSNDPAIRGIRTGQVMVEVFPDPGGGEVKLIAREGIVAFTGTRSERRGPMVPLELPHALYWTGSHRGAIWALTETGMLRSTTGEHWKPVHPQAGPSLDDVRGGTQCEDLLFLCTGTEMRCYQLQDATLHYRWRTPFQGRVHRAYRAPDGALWFTAPGRPALRFARGDPSVELPERFAPSTSVVECLVDREGLLWLVSNRDGVFRLASLDDRTIGRAEGLSSEDLYSLLPAPHGGLWVGTGDGTIEHIGSSVRTWNLFGTPNPAARVMRLVRAGSGCYIGSDQGAFHLGPDGVQGGYPHWTIKDVAVAANGDVLLAYHDGVRRCAPWPKGPCREIHDRRAMAILEEPDGRLLIGGMDGLTIAEGDTTGYAGLIRAVAGVRVTDLLRGTDGRIVVATHAGVVVRMPDGRLSRADRAGSGLCSDICLRVAEDERGRLWVCTNAGLDRLSWMDGRWEVRHITPADGLPDAEVRDVHVQGDSIWVATHKGLALLVDPVGRSVADPPVHIMGVRFNGRDTVLLPAYEVPYDRNDISIAFVALHMRSDGRITYRYRLADDAPWLTTTANSITLPRATPGTYAITVQARTADGVQGTRSARVTVRVRPAWWQRTWVQVALLLAVLGGSTALLRRRHRLQTRAAREQERQARTLAELELQAHRARIDPHFVFNCLNSIQAFILREDHELAHRYIAQFASYIRRTLRVARSNFIPLREEIALLREQTGLEMMRTRHAFSTTIDVDPQVDLDTEVPTMLLQTFVENAVKHGLNPLRDRPGELRVRFTVEDGCLLCTVTDNGVGLRHDPGDRSERPASEGLKLVRERIALFRAQFGLDIGLELRPRTDGEGTNVELRIPQEQTMEP